MKFGSIIKLVFAGWLIAEFAVFTLLVVSLGLGLTLVLGFVTTCLGLILLGKSSRETFRQLNARNQGGYTLILLGPARILAAMLLILPGFLTDLIGLLLSIPLIGKMFSARVSHRYRARHPDVLDLDAAEWRANEEKITRPTGLPEKF